MSLSVGAAGFLALVFLPGAWVTFGMPVPGVPLWARFLAGTTLSPLVVYFQYYAIRLLGASFEQTAILLVGLNAPALYLILKHVGRVSLPRCRTIAGSALVLVVSFAGLAPQLVDSQARLYTGHAWMHADIVYMIANGALFPEDPELAGVRLGYPWAGHVYQAILSYLLGSPPVSNYIWTNLVWLFCIYGFAAGLVAELGGNLRSRITSVIWLFFGVNFVGYVLQHIVPVSFAKAYPLWGDYRYTPWLLKFLFFNQMPFALGLFIAIVFLTIREGSRAPARYSVVLLGFLLSGIGIMYPLLFLPACAVIAAKASAILFDRSDTLRGGRRSQIIGLLVVLLIAGSVTAANLAFLSQDRVTETIRFSPLASLARKAVDSVVVTSPLLVGLGLIFPRCWTAKRRAMLVLLMSGLASLLLYVVFRFSGGAEYKFIFSAAICLAPFPSLALERLTNRLGRGALAGFAVVTLLLAAPFVHKIYRHWAFWVPPNPPIADVRNFDLRLDEKEPLSGLTDAIRQRTPTHSILVLDQASLHFPTVTRRQLYVPPSQKRPHPGVNLTSDHLLVHAKGYDEKILRARRATLSELFDPANAEARAQGLDQILKLRRPVAIVLDEQRHATLVEWLAMERIGKALYRENGFILWLIDCSIEDSEPGRPLSCAGAVSSVLARRGRADGAEGRSPPSGARGYPAHSD